MAKGNMRWLSYAGLLGAFLLVSCREPSGNLHNKGSVTATERVWPGKQPDGTTLLPNQWSLLPAGRQIELRDFPVNIAMHPGGKYAAVLHTGHSEHQISIIDLTTETAVSHTPISQSFYGIEFTADGKRLFCSGAGQEVIHEFLFENGQLGGHQEIRLRDIKKRGMPTGIAVDRGGRTLYAANLLGNEVSIVDLTGKMAPRDIVLGEEVPDLPIIDPSGDVDTVAADKRAQAQLLRPGMKVGFPYGCRIDPIRKRLFVSLWAQSEIAVIDLGSLKIVSHWRTQDHPCEMVLSRAGKLLYVANANRNTVSVIDTRSGKTLETLWAALEPNSPPGSTPNSLSLTPDEKTLFVANANINAVAVFDVSKVGHGRSLGFIPSGWYPTSVRVTADGKRLLIANGKGLSSKANPLGPQPGRQTRTVQTIADLFRGTLSFVDLPRAGDFEAAMREYTGQVYRCSPLKTRKSLEQMRTPANPIPASRNEKSPIKYCFYIIKENRTYDQVLGDMPEGNGDPQLCLFPEKVTPNEHKISRDYVLLDNFYADAEVSADGHEWSMGAYATDFVEKMWPMMYGHNKPGKYSYPAEGNYPIAFPSGGYLWDKAREAGVSYRSYGEFVNLSKYPPVPVETFVPSLKGHLDTQYRGFDLGYRDTARAERFISEFHRFEKQGRMPRLQILRLPNDHTHGSSRGKRTPIAYVAENDLALGQIIDAISHSSIWKESAIFITEDDAQNGPDHVDAHRTIAFIVSPYTKRGVVDSSLYSTTSMIRTMELILGLQPMSQFDAAALPMYNSFQDSPDFTPYTGLPARVDIEELNSEHAWGNRIPMNFAKEDAIDDLLLNEVVWRTVRGPDSPMPAPVRAGFVRPKPHTSGDGDD
jgi:DNA-binding beta-propeller fold protein YncE